MSHKYRDTAKGDVIDLRRRLQDLQQQLNDKGEAGKLLHAENQRLKQHIKGLEARLLDSVCPSSSAGLTASWASGSWSGRLASPTAGGTLRSSTAGEAAALRAFKQAAAQARAEAGETSAVLQTTQHQLQEARQQLRQLSDQHERLQSVHAATQQQLTHSTADNAALQDQVQRMQQVLQNKQQETLHLHQKLQQQTAQQQLQQQSSATAHQAEVQQLQATHTAELTSATNQLVLQHAQALDAVQQECHQLRAQLTTAQGVLQQLQQLERGCPGGWARQVIGYAAQHAPDQTDGNSTTADGIAVAASSQQQGDVTSSRRFDFDNLALQVLLHSMKSQPGYLGISKRDWWPLLLIHTMNSSGASSNGGSKQDGQLLAAVAARPPGDTAVSITAAAAVSSGSSAGSNKDGAMLAGDILHHQLQLQLPAEFDAAAAGWIRAGQLQLSLINAKAAVVGGFTMSRDAVMPIPSSTATHLGPRAQEQPQQPQQRSVLALLLPLGMSCKCWVLGLYETTADCQPGPFIGFLSKHHAPSSCYINSAVSESSWTALPWSTAANWVQPDLLPGEFLVPVDTKPAATAVFAGSAAAAEVTTGTDEPSLLYTAARNSGLFSRTSKGLNMELTTTDNSSSSRDDMTHKHSCSIPCEVWAIQPAAVRAAVSRSATAQDITVAEEPWIGAATVLGAATLPVAPAVAAASAGELAAKLRCQLLLQEDCSRPGNEDQQIADSSGSSSIDSYEKPMQLDLLHSRGKAIAQVQLSLRFNRPVRDALRSCAQLQQAAAAHAQAETALQSQIRDQQASMKELQTQIGVLQAQCDIEQQQLQEQQQLLEQQQSALQDKQQQVGALEAQLQQLQAEAAALQDSHEDELQQLKAKLAQEAEQYAADVARQRKRAELLEAENQQQQQLLEQQLQQLDDLEGQLAACLVYKQQAAAATAVSKIQQLDDGVTQQSAADKQQAEDDKQLQPGGHT